MKTRALGPSGLQVSEVGLRCNNFGGRIDFFDTADSYGDHGGSETLLGRVLGERRKDVILATKFGSPMQDGVTRRNASRRYLMQALDDLIRAGKLRYVGACNLAAWQVVEAEWAARELGTHRFVCAQNAQAADLGLSADDLAEIDKALETTQRN